MQPSEEDANTRLCLRPAEYPVDLGGPAMARVARDYGYTLAELRKL
jgi:hypothetical protein